MDETYIRVAGRWSYLDRAVDSAGATLDFWFSAERDTAAAKRFFQRALKVPGRRRPRVIHVDGNPSYPKVITELKPERHLGRVGCALLRVAGTSITSRLVVKESSPEWHSPMWPVTGKWSVPPLLACTTHCGSMTRGTVPHNALGRALVIATVMRWLYLGAVLFPEGSCALR